MAVAIATLERDGTTLELPLLAEGGGAPLVGQDIGKPESGPSNKGSINPRWQDQWSRSEGYTLSVRYTESDAYSRAIELADLLKSHSDGEDLLLNIDYPNTMTTSASPQLQSKTLR
ncbi:hypothetical protein HALLA_12145 [Halostagnicola larsenii XH-48]|uniref:Uncharacterized protein n=1 Tax=Halostagnicola larsenii XH-48 TaxID=797299 RepID=W0JQH0_9EURY|nr:hypothetical protein [Halostagnicola larsenii]AHG00976.1 hypothetical protein HALLA_12145 [Halostagnicola larsenii XH-48]